MKNPTKAEAGCWIAGSNGHYGVAVLVEIALNYPGYLRAGTRAATTYARTQARHVVRAYHAGEDTVSYRRKPKYGTSYVEKVEDVFEYVAGQGGLADEAEEFLNTIAPKGYTFGWESGEFFLMPDEWWEDDAA